MATVKPIKWQGTSLEDIKQFPPEAMHEAGYQLGRVQQGLEPSDWKPFNQIGAGVKEIRIRDRSGIYRVMYVAKFVEAIYVLHAFQKKTQTTSKQDKNIAIARFRDVIVQRGDL